MCTHHWQRRRGGSAKSFCVTYQSTRDCTIDGRITATTISDPSQVWHSSTNIWQVLTIFWKILFLKSLNWTFISFASQVPITVIRWHHQGNGSACNGFCLRLLVTQWKRALLPLNSVTSSLHACHLISIRKRNSVSYISEHMTNAFVSASNLTGKFVLKILDQATLRPLFDS